MIGPASPDIMFGLALKNLAVESNSTPLTMLHTKLEAISSKDVGGDRFQTNIHASQQFSYFRLCNFRLIVPMKMMILMFLESECKDLSKNVSFCYPLTKTF